LKETIQTLNTCTTFIADIKHHWFSMMTSLTWSAALWTDFILQPLTSSVADLENFTWGGKGVARGLGRVAGVDGTWQSL